LYEQPENTYTQPLTLGVDTGSAVIGSAVADEQGNILYLSEVEVRNDIADTSDRARHPSSTSPQPKDALSACALVKSKEFHQDRAIFTNDEKQDRRSSARDSLCAILVADHVHRAGNRNL
jgi:hypothetical protein